MSKGPPSVIPSERLQTFMTCVLSAAAMVFFYVWLKHFGPQKGGSVVSTWSDAWNRESDFEHGWIFPILLPCLLLWRGREIADSKRPGEWIGLIPAVFGALLYVLAYRTIQWRVAVIGLPFLVIGSVWYLWGRGMARLVAFPLLLIWLAIPVGFLQQATGGLQLIATQLAHNGSALFGVGTTILGNRLMLGDGTGFDVDEGCSGIRSLWALMMIASSWIYVARIPVWKRILLFLSVFPIAIIGNALRLISIFVIAKYGSANFAGKTWHDWSPLIFFYPISLCLLLAVHSILEGGLPWRKARRLEIRRSIVRQSVPVPTDSSPS